MPRFIGEEKAVKSDYTYVVLNLGKILSIEILTYVSIHFHIFVVLVTSISQT